MVRQSGFELRHGPPDEARFVNKATDTLTTNPMPRSAPGYAILQRPL
jgi:hypothetical protein